MKLLLFFGLFWTSVNAQADSVLLKSCSETSFRSYLPVTTAEQQIVQHTYYSLGYNEAYEQALWVCYVLDSADCTGGEERSSRFFVDPLVKTASASDADYAKSGYDRGHLAPAGDMGFSPVAMKESFYYSNMSPQVPAFNRGIWKKLETQVREWAKTHHSLLVISGPIVGEKFKSIGKDEVAVPDYYYKIIIDPKTSQALGFILPNEASDKPLSDFVVTVTDIERRTGINFLPELSRAIEKKIENQVNSVHWFSTSN